MAPTPQVPDPTPTLTSLQRRLDDVRNYQLPRLGSSKSTALARDLASEARADLESVRIGLEEVREVVEALPPSRREVVRGVCVELEGAYIATRNEYRAALVESKRACQANLRRHELLEPMEDDKVGVPKAAATTSVGGDDALQTKTDEVTDAYQRTTMLLQAELERSVLSAQMLNESTNTLRTTTTLYDTYTDILSTSAKLVKALERADWWDRAIILAALALFLLVVVYIIKRRVLDRVGGFAAWWVGGSYKLVKLGLGGGGGKEAVKAVKVAGEVAGTGIAAAGAIAGAAGAGAGRGVGAGVESGVSQSGEAAKQASPLDIVPSRDADQLGDRPKDEL